MVEIISGRRKCNVLRGLVLQAMVKVTILADLADFSGTREAHFNTGSRPDNRVPGYPLRTLVHIVLVYHFTIVQSCSDLVICESKIYSISM